MATYRKSILDLTVAIGGLNIGQGGGEGDFLEVTSPEQTTAKTGIHGDVVFHDTPNNVYGVNLSLLDTSPLNSSMVDILSSQRGSSSQGPTSMTITDSATGFRLSGQVMITKEPDITENAESQNRQWQLMLASPDGIQYQTATPIV